MTSFRMLLLLLAVSATAEERYFVGPRALPPPPSYDMRRVVADVTGDGRNDLVYLKRSGLEIHVYAATAGGYEPPILSRAEYAFTEDPLAVDLDNDGALDLFGKVSNGSVLLLGDGNGRFGAARFTYGWRHLSVVADFDRDGRPDDASIRVSPDLALELRRGTGDGNFAAPIVVDRSLSLRESYDAVTADLDGDRWPDIAYAADSRVIVFWNERAGTFRRREYRIPALTIEAGHLNGDGRADLLTSVRGVAAVWFSRDARRFERSPHPFAAGDTSHTLHDLDGNGTADVIAARDGAISVTLSHPGDTFGARRLYFTGTDVTGLAVADVDSDGAADVAYGWEEREPPSFEPSQWLRGNGDGTLDASLAVDLCELVPCRENEVRQEAVADVTGDGVGDYVVYTHHRLTVIPARANGTVLPAAVTRLTPVLSDRPTAHFQSLGDIDGDGRDDLLLTTAHRDQRRRLTGVTATVLHGQRDGTFEEAQSWAFDSEDGWLWQEVVADFTGDGLTDILRRNGDLYPGDGRGRFGTRIPIAGMSGISHLNRAADLDGNGHIDVVGADAGGWDVWLNQGDGTFVWREHDEGERDVDDSVFAELTGDGIPDLVDVTAVWKHGNQCCYEYYDGNEAPVWRGRGDGSFVPLPFSIRLPKGRDGLATLDFNGDGRTDLAIGAEIYLGQGDGTFLSGALFDADLAALSNGTVIARRGHVYAPLRTMLPSSRVPVSMEISPRCEWPGILQVSVASPTQVPPDGTVVFEYDGATRIARVEWGVAWLECEPREETTVIRATYSGDERFAPATSVQQVDRP